jgi:hypothetical protein
MPRTRHTETPEARSKRIDENARSQSEKDREADEAIDKMVKRSIKEQGA